MYEVFNYTTGETIGYTDSEAWALYVCSGPLDYLAADIFPSEMDTNVCYVTSVLR